MKDLVLSSSLKASVASALSITLTTSQLEFQWARVCFMLRTLSPFKSYFDILPVFPREMVMWEHCHTFCMCCAGVLTNILAFLSHTRRSSSVRALGRSGSPFFPLSADSVRQFVLNSNLERCSVGEKRKCTFQVMAASREKTETERRRGNGGKEEREEC